MDPKYLNEMLTLCADKDFVFASRYLEEEEVMTTILSTQETVVSRL